MEPALARRTHPARTLQFRAPYRSLPARPTDLSPIGCSCYQTVNPSKTTGPALRFGPSGDCA